MEGVVASRRLRKSYTDSYNLVKNTNEYILDKNLNKNKEYNINYFKVKVIFKVVCSVGILLVCSIANMFGGIRNINNIYVKNVYYEYKKDYSKLDFLEKFEDVAVLVDNSTDNIVPEKIKNYIVYNYLTHVKPYFCELSIKEIVVKLLNNTPEEFEENTEEVIATMNSNMNYIYKVDDVDNNDEILEIEEIIEEPQEEIVDFSKMTECEIIKYKNIDIIKPVNGVITSVFGEREEVIKGVGTNHTGIDIANKLGTNIMSATSGKVTKIEYNNKYYGNFIEITTDDVVFKYAHLAEILVNNDDSISQGDIIAHMGSTGFSTGSHLHFEIKYNGICVNPQEILNFD